MKISAGEIRVGMLLEYKNDLWQVLKTQHVKPGKGGAFAQVEMKSVNKNTKLNERFRSSETVEKASVEENLYNYLYVGFIANQIPNAKIIHCFRNPLDNILSIYRANFENGNRYTSSLVDSAKVYLDQEKIMCIYKKKFRAKIYDLNYDLLVKNPQKEIQSLINWLGWEWNDAYLSPHLNKRAVYTASDIQVRYPINSKSIGGWKNYKDMLKPSIEILKQTARYRDLL